jgi:hypothetical protein
MNSDGTISTPYGTYSDTTSYNIANDCTDSDNPNHMTQSGYLSGDDRMMFLILNQNIRMSKTSTVYDSKNNQMTAQEYIKKYGITSADLAAYNITVY